MSDNLPPEELVKALRERLARMTSEPGWLTFYMQKAEAKLILALIERLEARVAELEGALKPSAETKCAYIGEFHFDIGDWDDDGEERPRRMVAVPWTTIKEIMAAIRAHATPGDRP